MVNGEKVLPLPIEGRVREDELVREAAVIGVDQPIPWLLIFRAKRADYMSDEAYINAIWPSVADANSRAEGFSQITREMISLLPFNVEYRQTNKGSIIRIAGLYNLLRFCLSVHRPEPARMLFCSSLSTALNMPHPASIPEAPIADLTHVLQIGYARSKFGG